MGSKVLIFVLLAPALAQAQAPADQAYEAVRAKNYDGAIASFRKAVEDAPQRADLRKDLAYTLLKIGETEAARDLKRYLTKHTSRRPLIMPVILEV